MLDKSFHKQRRAAFMQQALAGSVAIFPACKEVRRSRDTEFLFRQDSDFWYLTGFNEPDAWLVLRKQRDGVTSEHLFCRPKDKMAEIWQGRRLGPEAAIETLAIENCDSNDELESKLADLIKNTQTVYWPIGEHQFADELINSVIASVRAKPKLMSAPTQLMDSRVILHELRLIKTQQEVEVMRKACQISAEAHKRAMVFSKPGMFEYQTEAEIHHEFAMNGARSPAYGTIVASGDNANILHYTENSDELNDGDLLLIDAGCELYGYAADITRTFPANGKFSEPQQALYDLTLKAQLASLELIKPGNTIKQATDRAIEVISAGLVELGLLPGTADEVIEQKTYREFFMHGLSHWLGLDVHDVGEYKIDEQERPLESGMVLTVEPGIYVAKGSDVAVKWQGIGIRIEDNVLITEDGYENLTESVPKERSEIEHLIALGRVKEQ